MLTRLSVAGDCSPRITKTVNGKDASSRGAFPCGSIIDFTVSCPRSLGSSAVVLRIARDGEAYRDLPLSYVRTENGVDEYALSLDTAELCGAVGEGLFYYELLFLRGVDTLFTDTYNFVDFSLERQSGGRFILLIHKADFDTPEWFKGSIMYHIFVDRFYAGEGEIGERDDVIINPDWDNGIMQYPEKAGDKLANNMFFGGNLWGIAEKLPYLRSLGVGVIYLSPIFKAYSNHKYDTGNYLEIDEMFGGEAAFKNLLDKAREQGIRIILDGVFNHTGDDSLYFDRYEKYGKTGAYSNPDSPFRDWFRFRSYPDEYETWWGIQILPKLNHSVDACREYFTGKDGVCERYIKMGIGGWRLDVADELSDTFLDELREVVKGASGDEGIIIGEVWENAAEKISYSQRRRYLRGDQLDSVMNYPFRNAALALLVDGDAPFFADILKSVYASYPKCVCDALMNLLGTHDTERILTVLGNGNRDLSGYSNADFAVMKLSDDDREMGIALLKLAATLQYTVYGVPSVFYGDEAGVEGYSDPFCRKTYPWGRECEELLAHYRLLGEIRTQNSVFKDGEFEIERAEGALVVYSRFSGEDRITVAVNASSEAAFVGEDGRLDLLSGTAFSGVLAPMSAVILN